MVRVVIAVVLGCVILRASGQEIGPLRAPPAGATNRVSDDVVAQVLKLLRAGTAPALVVGFINQWPKPYLTSVADLERLRQAGANSAILSAFSRRGAELRLQARRTSRPSASNNGPPTIGSPVPLYAAPMDLSAPEWNSETPYIFSEALWWWVNYYPFPYDFASYPFWGGPHDHRH